MPHILDAFNKPTVLNYLQTRQYQAYAVGESLFPEVKYDTLDFEYIVGADELPVVAKVHAFDTEAEIGSIEAKKQMLEAAYIKKKYQITEKDLVALQYPRTPAEQEIVTGRIFNLVDKAVNDVRSRVELMRMQALANGTLSLDVWTGGSATPNTITVDYGVPANQKVTLAGADLWSAATADIIGDITTWSNIPAIRPSFAVTTRAVLGNILKNTAVLNALYGAGSGRVGNLADLNNFLVGQGLPTIVIVDGTPNSQYRVQAAAGTYTTATYFPQDKFVLIPAGPLGNTLYGPTPDENKFIRDNVITQYNGNVIGYIYEEGQDPIGTWCKAASTAIPSFPQAANVVQAKVI